MAHSAVSECLEKAQARHRRVERRMKSGDDLGVIVVDARRKAGFGHCRKEQTIARVDAGKGVDDVADGLRPKHDLRRRQICYLDPKP